MSGPILTRADTLTQIQKQPQLYSDVLDDFSPHPITGDIAIIKNESDIKQALKNLIFTNLGERFFQPNVGSIISRMLFDVNDSTTAGDVQHYITQTIQNYEPRVQLISVNAVPTPDTNSFSVTIQFLIINTNTLQTLQFILQRVR